MQEKVEAWGLERSSSLIGGYSCSRGTSAGAQREGPGRLRIGLGERREKDSRNRFHLPCYLAPYQPPHVVYFCAV